jgi:hypothetical protein
MNLTLQCFVLLEFEGECCLKVGLQTWPAELTHR